MSSPILRFYPYTNLDEELELSSKLFFQGNVRLDLAKNEIHLPSVFGWYPFDFGSSMKQRLDFIKDYMNEGQLVQFERIRSSNSFVVKFMPYNWTMNQLDKDEEANDTVVEFEDVIHNPRLRKFYKAFSKGESSEENISCYEEIEKWEKASRSASNLNKFKNAYQIYTEFLISKAPREVNVSHKEKEEFESQLLNQHSLMQQNPKYVPQLSNHLFQNLKRSLIINQIDIYIRFQKSKLYHEMIVHQLESNLLEVANTTKREHEARKTVLDASRVYKVKPTINILQEIFEIRSTSDGNFEEIIPVQRTKNLEEKLKQTRELISQKLKSVRRLANTNE